MCGAPRHPAGDDVRAAVEVDEELGGGRLAQDVAVPAFECRAADDGAGGGVVGQPLADRLQPGQAVPADILATLAAGWKSSASANGTPSRCASAAPTVVFPEPDTPMTVISGGGEGEVGIVAVLSSRRVGGVAEERPSKIVERVTLPGGRSSPFRREVRYRPP